MRGAGFGPSGFHYKEDQMIPRESIQAMIDYLAGDEPNDRATQIEIGDIPEGDPEAAHVWTHAERVQEWLNAPEPEFTPSDDLKEAWEKYQRGEHIEAWELRKLDEERGDWREDILG